MFVVLMMVVNVNDVGMFVNHISMMIVVVMNTAVEVAVWTYVVTVAPENLTFEEIVNKKKQCTGDNMRSGVIFVGNTKTANEVVGVVVMRDFEWELMVEEEVKVNK